MPVASGRAQEEVPARCSSWSKGSPCDTHLTQEYSKRAEVEESVSEIKVFPGAFACMLCESLSAEYGNKQHGSTDGSRASCKQLQSFLCRKLGAGLRGSCRLRGACPAELNLSCPCARLSLLHYSPITVALKSVPSFTGSLQERD